MEAFFASLTALFAVGTFWFFALVVLAVLAITLEVAYDKGTSATFTLLGTVTFVHFFAGFNVILFLRENVLWVALGALVYIVAGAVWSLAKLAFVVKNIDDRYRALRVEFCKEYKIKNGDKIAGNKEEVKWLRVLRDNYIDIDTELGRPTYDYRKHRDTVVMWIGHWPFSMLGTLLNDPVRRAVNFAYERMDRAYAAVVNKILGKYAGDLLTDEETELAVSGSSQEGKDGGGYHQR